MVDEAMIAREGRSIGGVVELNGDLGRFRGFGAHCGSQHVINIERAVTRKTRRAV